MAEAGATEIDDVPSPSFPARVLLFLAERNLGTLLIVAALIVVVAALAPSAFYLRVAALVWVMAIAAIGLNLLMGYAGQVSLGHAAFLGIGAYAVAILPDRYGVPSLLAVLVGAAISGGIALLVGRPILRLSGHYLAVATLGFGVLISIVLGNEAWLTGGPDGMNVPRLVIFGARLRTAETWYWISGGLLVVGVWLALNLVDSPSGRALRAIHDSEVAARVLGVDTAAFKLKIFVVSAVYASIAGSALALFDGHITPDAAGFVRSVELVTMIVIGGLGSITGSIVGAAVITVLPQALTVLAEWSHVMLGALIIVFMIFLRAGIVPSLRGLFLGRRR